MTPISTHWAPSSDLGSRLPPIKFDNYGKYQRLSCDRFTGTVCLMTTPKGHLAYIKIQNGGSTWRRIVVSLPDLEGSEPGSFWAWYREHVVSTCGALIWSCLRADRAAPLTSNTPAYWEHYLALRSQGDQYQVPPEVASQFRGDLWSGTPVEPGSPDGAPTSYLSGCSAQPAG